MQCLEEILPTFFKSRCFFLRLVIYLSKKGADGMKRWIGWLSVLLLIGIGATGCVRDAGEDSAFEYTITDGEAELTAYTGTQ